MDKANIIISIIIVLCIAAAVTAYGLTNSNSPIFSDLSSMGSNDDTGDGLGNNTTITNESTVSTQPSNSESSSSGGSNSVSSSSSSNSGSNGGSSSSGSESSSKHNTVHTTLSYSEAKSIANGAVAEPGCYAGSGYYSGGSWYFKIYDENGKVVDGIAVDDATGHTSRA